MHIAIEEQVERRTRRLVGANSTVSVGASYDNGPFGAGAAYTNQKYGASAGLPPTSVRNWGAGVHQRANHGSNAQINGVMDANGALQSIARIGFSTRF